MAETSEYSQKYLDAKKALDDAIAEFHRVNAEEHEDTNPQFVVGWVVITASTGYATKGTNYAWVAPQNQPWHHSIGLVQYANKTMND